MEETVAKFSNGPLWQKPERGPWSAARRAMVYMESDIPCELLASLRLSVVILPL